MVGACAAAVAPFVPSASADNTVTIINAGPILPRKVVNYTGRCVWITTRGVLAYVPPEDYWARPGSSDKTTLAASQPSQSE